MPKLINFFGGPGIGKSTTAMAVTVALKHLNQKVEYVPEFAKELVFRTGQVSVAPELLLQIQKQRLDTVYFAHEDHKVDYVVTDSPLLLCAAYGFGNDIQLARILREYNSLNIFLNRLKTYQTYGRTQTYEEAVELDKKILQILVDYNQGFIRMDAKSGVEKTIAEGLVNGRL